MVFNIGDRVRFKNDATNQRWSVVDIYPAIGKVQICAKDLGVYRVVEPSLLVEVDPVSEIKQAIREVLLSDEFLKAFAAAWVKTPLIHKSEMNLTIEPITKDDK
jgi:hypothetical protein